MTKNKKKWLCYFYLLNKCIPNNRINLHVLNNYQLITNLSFTYFLTHQLPTLIILKTIPDTINFLSPNIFDVSLKDKGCFFFYVSIVTFSPVKHNNNSITLLLSFPSWYEQHLDAKWWHMVTSDSMQSQTDYSYQCFWFQPHVTCNQQSLEHTTCT